MRSPLALMGLCLLVTCVVVGPVRAAEHGSWKAYMKANRYKCPGPLDTLAKPRNITLAGKPYRHSGYRLEVLERDDDTAVKLGVVSAIKDVSFGTKHNIKESLAWFEKEGVEWILANGDLALEEFDLEEVIQILAEPGLPLLVVLGNSESVGSFARVFKTLQGRYPNLVNGVWVRQIVADDVEFWTVSGYHDKVFVYQGAGCRYDEADLKTLRTSLEASNGTPVTLVSHGPPRGRGSAALDWIADKQNVGDPLLAELISKKEIPFGIFGHILEAGGRAVGKGLTGSVPQGRSVASLYLNAGSLSADPWAMNDGSTSRGMALVVSIEAGKATYQVKRLTPPQEE